MSLKAFHLVFIIASILMAFGFATWSFLNYFSPVGEWTDLASGIVAIMAGFGLVVYERFFLRKFKNVSYI